MGYAITWFLVCATGVAIWAGIAADSLYFWLQLGNDRDELAASYFRELVGDTSILAILVAGALIGIAALTLPNTDHAVEAALVIGLYSGPVGLTLLGVYRYWRRRAGRK